MRQLSTIFLLISFFLLINITPANSAVTGGIEYSIPIDYNKLSESELTEKALTAFDAAINTEEKEVTGEVTNALFLYTILQSINPENIDYSVKLGRLYDKIGKDRYAKGNFSRAIGIDSSKPEAYFYFGEYYYSRQLYRRALKYYNEAYNKGYSSNYDLLLRLSDIYEKFGNPKRALKYLSEAGASGSNEELEDKIQRIMQQDSVNNVYNKEVKE